MSFTLALCLVPYYGLGLISFWLAQLWFFLIIAIRFILIVYADFKFVLFEIQIFDIKPLFAMFATTLHSEGKKMS